MSDDRGMLRIYVVSGGVGACGEQVINTVLAQFPEGRVEVVTLGNVRDVAQVEQAVMRAKETRGIIAFTFVDVDLGVTLAHLARQHGVSAVDLFGPLLELLSRELGVAPLGRPGLYRHLNREYFCRVSAIEYSIGHDDGQGQETWHEGDLLLLGVSRTGKTPLSIYLSVLGWKVANFPIVPGLPVPETLFQLDRRRVVGLTISQERLLAFRRQRSMILGMDDRNAYVDPLQIAGELACANRIIQRGGFDVLDVTDQTVEASANELIKRFSSLIGERRIPPV